MQLPLDHSFYVYPDQPISFKNYYLMYTEHWILEWMRGIEERRGGRGLGEDEREERMRGRTEESREGREWNIWRGEEDEEWWKGMMEEKKERRLGREEGKKKR